MKGMKWVIALNAALAGIVILIGSVFAFSWIRGIMRPAPAAPAVVVDKKPDFQQPLPLKVPPVCNQGFDPQEGQLLMHVKNVSDQPLSYEVVEVGHFVDGRWIQSGVGIGCGSGGARETNTFVIKAGQTKVFRETVSGKMFPVRFSLRLASPDGRVSEIPIGEFRPSTCFSQLTTD